MARSDLLIALVKAAITGDKSLAKTSAEAIIADERVKQHHTLADRLLGVLQSGLKEASTSPRISGSQQPHIAAHELFVELIPRRSLDDLLLLPETRAACDDLIEEQRRAGLLRSHSLEPRHRILMSGPPGNGKTTLAEAIAEALSYPLLVVRYESIIGSYLGETATRLRRVFDYARTTPCVLFFDEFDVVGKERGDTNETGEIKRVVSSLLLQVDNLPTWTIIAAATNHAELLDRAVWRRFQLRLDLPAPNKEQLLHFVSRFFTERGMRMLDRASQRIADSLSGASIAEAEELCTNILRRQVLLLGTERLEGIAEREVLKWRTRANAPAGSQKGK